MRQGPSRNSWDKEPDQDGESAGQGNDLADGGEFSSTGERPPSGPFGLDIVGCSVVASVVLLGLQLFLVPDGDGDEGCAHEEGAEVGEVRPEPVVGAGGKTVCLIAVGPGDCPEDPRAQGRDDEDDAYQGKQ